MKLRNLLMTAVFLLAVTASFASKAKRFDRSAYTILVDQCISTFIYENNCTVTNTGPVCTSTIGDGIAYGGAVDGVIPCTVALHKP